MLRPPEQLAPECREFQQRYEGDRRDGHLEDCADCGHFVEFVDGLRRLGLATPLADDLRARLRSLPELEEGVAAFPRVPELPLPTGLARRLQRIARQGVRELPIWIRSPRYAIAASYLLTLLIGGTVGNPAAWANEAGSGLRTVGTALNQVQANGRETWSGIGEKATDGFHTTQDYLRDSTSTLRARWIELTESIAEPDTINDKNTTDDEVDDESPSDPSS